MSSKERKNSEREKIKRAIKISSQKLIEKKALGQNLVISENGRLEL